MGLWNINVYPYLAAVLLLIFFYRYPGMMLCLAVMAAGAVIWPSFDSEPSTAMLILLVIGSALGVLLFRAERSRLAKSAPFPAGIFSLDN